MRASVVVVGLVGLWALAACSPGLNWREVRPVSSGLVALFPCKPASQARRVTLAGAEVEMTLYACSAEGVTYAVGFADVGQPQQVSDALGELLAAAVRNVGAPAGAQVVAFRIEGMTPNGRAGRTSMEGALGDGRRVNESVAVFARGTWVYQATMVGPTIEAEAAETFFGGLRLPA